VINNIEIMKIYVVSHYYDNGESYEDYREYEEHKLYSTLQIASEYFWASVVGDYEGKYVLTEWELDTQEKKTLEESAWVKCKPYYNEEWQGEPEPDDENYDYTPDPGANALEALKYLVVMEDREAYLRELDLEREWLTHEGTNYQEWKECEEEIKKKKSDILLDELNSMLIDLLDV
jgi:hypothetical protein